MTNPNETLLKKFSIRNFLKAIGCFAGAGVISFVSGCVGQQYNPTAIANNPESKIRKPEAKTSMDFYNYIRERLEKTPLNEIDPQGKTFKEIMNEKGYDFNIIIFGAEKKSGVVNSGTGVKTRTLPWANENLTPLPSEYWLKFGDKIFWLFEVELTNKNGARKERWAARFIQSPANPQYSVLGFNAIEIEDNGISKEFIKQIVPPNR